MRYDQFNTLLAAASSDLDRRRIIAAEDQDHTQGIVDDTTVCDKNYWERDYGVMDAIVALFDILSGRDAVGPLDIMNVLEISPTATTIRTNVSIVGDFDVVGAAEIWGAFTLHGNVNATNITASNSLIFGNIGGLYDNTINTVERTIPAHIGEYFPVIGEESGDMIFMRPLNNSEYQSLGYGGGFTWRTGDEGLIPMHLTNRGHLNLGGIVNEAPNSSPGITARLLTDTIFDIRGRAEGTNPNHTFDTRITSWRRDPLLGSANKYSAFSVKATADGDVDARFDFIVDDVIVAHVDGYGDASFRGIYADADIDAPNGDITASGITIGSGGSLIAGGDFLFHGIVSAEQIYASNGLYANNTYNALYCALSPTACNFTLSNIAGSYSAGMGLFSSKADVPVIWASGASKKIEVIGGTNAIAANFVTLSLPIYAAGQQSSIELETSKFMFVKNGVVKIADKNTDLGGSTLGYHKIETDATGCDFSAGQATIDAACTAISKAVLGATVVMYNTNASKFNLCVYDGTNWKYVQLS